jgi:hypothetical protein
VHIYVQGDVTLQFQAQQGALTLEQEINQIGLTHNFTKLVSRESALHKGWRLAGS